MTQFYLALLVGRTVQAAFDIAKAAVAADPQITRSDEPKKFLLLPEDTSHHVPIFGDIPDGEWKDKSQPAKPVNVPAMPGLRWL